jgi:hypothetical protein
MNVSRKAKTTSIIKQREYILIVVSRVYVRIHICTKHLCICVYYTYLDLYIYVYTLADIYTHNFIHQNK